MRFYCNVCKDWIEDENPMEHMSVEHADMALDDRYRWCVFCGADCWPERENQEHDPECPSVTGLYPVREDDFTSPDKDGNLVYHGLRCMDCGTELKTGDIYVHREVETQRMIVPGASENDVYEIVCVGCGALAEAAAGPRTE